MSTISFSEEGKWIEGYGQGNLEYFIDKQGYRLYIGCPTEDGSADAPSYISLSTLKDGKAIEPFTIIVNGNTYEAPFEADNHAGENNFISILEDLRKGNAVVKFGKKTIIFPKSNAKEIIPVYGSKDFSCNLLWSK